MMALKQTWILGHYERFSGIYHAKKSDNITTGKIYNDVIKKESKR